MRAAAADASTPLRTPGREPPEAGDSTSSRCRIDANTSWRQLIMWGRCRHKKLPGWSSDCSASRAVCPADLNAMTWHSTRNHSNIFTACHEKGFPWLIDTGLQQLSKVYSVHMLLKRHPSTSKIWMPDLHGSGDMVAGRCFHLFAEPRIILKHYSCA